MKKQQLRDLFIVIVLISLSGCTSKQKIDILSEKQKYIVYQNVLNDIDYYKKMGDMYYKNDYLLAAISAYKKVNFYEGKDVYSKFFLDKMNLKAKLKGQIYYNKALNLISKNKIKSLYFLNKMMQNNPEIKKGKSLFKELKLDIGVKFFLSKKELDVSNELKKDMNTVEGIASLNNALKNLIDYDNESAIAIKAKEIIKKHYNPLIEKAVSLYNEKNYKKAKNDLNLLKSIYIENRTIEKYLNLIYTRENIEKAENLLFNKNYNEAIAIARKYPNNDEAKKIVNLSKNAREDQIPILIKLGMERYDKQDLINAQKVFQKILTYNPREQTAITYVKKIKEQLKTIKSLR